jgi:uncharacterized protein YqhQ
MMRNAVQSCAEKSKPILKLTRGVTFAIVIIINHVFTFFILMIVPEIIPNCYFNYLRHCPMSHFLCFPVQLHQFDPFLEE